MLFKVLPRKFNAAYPNTIPNYCVRDMTEAKWSISYRATAYLRSVWQR